ncbi:MAG: hypothetical protein JNJ88_03400 [Planctomycetes bacterium]|nr:hypothetical protein [Planctomycetota bacterium]
MRPNVHFCVLGWLLVAALPSVAVGQTVRKVPSGGSIQAAVAVSRPGDVILLTAGGSYGGFTLDSKAVSVVCDGSPADIFSAVIVKNLLPNQNVILRGLRVNWYAVSIPPLQLLSNAGSVWVEDCAAYGDGYDVYLTAGAVISACASVNLRGCRFEGAPGYYTGTPYSIQGQPGLVVSSSTVNITDTLCLGGAGGPIGLGGCGVSGGGGGASVTNSLLFASGTTFRGGNGGKKSGCTNQGHGGDGFTSSGSQVFTIGCVFLGGSVDGAGISGDPVLQRPGTARSFSVSSPVREQQPVALDFAGIPGEQTGLLASGAPIAPLFFADLRGALVVDLALADALLTGPIGSDGVLHSSLTVPTLPSSVEGLTFYLQSFFFDLTVPHAALGPASSLVLLDSSL